MKQDAGGLALPRDKNGREEQRHGNPALDTQQAQLPAVGTNLGGLHLAEAQEEHQEQQWRLYAGQEAVYPRPVWGQGRDVDIYQVCQSAYGHTDGQHPVFEESQRPAHFGTILGWNVRQR